MNRRNQRWLACVGLLVGGVVGFAYGSVRHRASVAPRVVVEVPRFSGVYRTLAEEERMRTAAQKIAALHDPIRDRILPADEVIRLLAPQPGMGIVDVGAGAGHISLPLAKHMAGAGTVWAVDIDKRMVQLLQTQVSKPGLRSLRPILLAPGQDEFYRRHIFDRVLLCSVVEYLPSPRAFLRLLASRLHYPDGRLLLIQGRAHSAYFREDFEQYLNLPALLSQPSGRAVLARVDAGLRQQVLALTTSPPSPLAARLAVAFDGLLDQPNLFLVFQDATGTTLPDVETDAEQDHADSYVWRWLHHHLAQAGVLQGHTPPPPGPLRHLLRTHNWLLMRDFFNAVLPRQIFPRNIYLSAQGLERRLRHAGLRLVSSPTTLPAYDVLLFAPMGTSRPQAQP